jgi:chromate transporter
VVLSYGWLNDEQLTYMIAVSESTPGPIMINLATYIGSDQGGILGAALATIAVALPAFLLILLIMIVLKNILKNRYVQATLGGLQPCIIGIILSTGIYMTLSNLIPAKLSDIDWRAIGITGVLAAITFGSKPLLKKKVSPIVLILIAAVLGMIVYSF